MIKIVFFDIDGTLIPFGAKEMNPKVQEALYACKENGIKLFIATGRPYFSVPKFNFPFDGYLCCNGSYCRNDKEIIYKNPISKEDLDQLLINSSNMDEPVALANEHAVRCNFHKDTLDQYFTDNSQTVETADDFEGFCQSDIYQGMIGITAEYDDVILKDCKNLAIARWWPYACDVIPANGGKDIGIQKIIDYYGIQLDECMAIGDGGNDKSMIQYAGIGVAMGNAFDEVKEVADYITDPVDKDGVYTALKHFQLF